ncbi:unnamed protein product [Polarella glacialis]|uniref:Uncharacterized protein n=1 Tax=Polarella glacialis TaxID=89957 RepID=A0A813KLM3_POLGL|nr:unnamed protein product [Polarella glacialis]
MNNSKDLQQIVGRFLQFRYDSIGRRAILPITLLEFDFAGKKELEHNLFSKHAQIGWVKVWKGDYGFIECFEYDVYVSSAVVKASAGINLNDMQPGQFFQFKVIHSAVASKPSLGSLRWRATLKAGENGKDVSMN